MTEQKADNPLVSVQMLCYNSEAFVAEAIRSVRDQTYANWELVVVDDGSEDDMAKIVAELAREDDRIRYHRNARNLKTGASRQVALDCSNGELIAFCDSDDTWEPHKLEKQVPLFENASIGLVYSDAYRMDEAGERYGLLIGNRLSFPQGRAFKEIVDFCPPCLTVVIRRVPGLRSERRYQIVQDHDMFLQVSRDLEVAGIREPLASYRSHGGQITRRRAEGIAELFMMYRDWATREEAPELKTFLEGRAATHLDGVIGGRLSEIVESRDFARLENIVDALRWATGLRLIVLILLTLPRRALRVIGNRFSRAR